MIAEEEKYRAETFRFTGMAMLAPFGALLLTPFALYDQLEIFGFIIYCLVASISLVIGVIIIENGRNILDRKESKQWKH